MEHPSQQPRSSGEKDCPEMPVVDAPRNASITTIGSASLADSPPTSLDIRSPSYPLDSLASRKRSISHLDLDPDECLQSPVTASLPCLCTPEPKIPRPRNAFILYRQHHYAAVVAKYPGITNPDISKLIGEAWRNENESEKAKWKGYAEEDKAQHHQRYPSYRYQPKRSQKGSTGGDGSWSEGQACPRCSRRPLPLHLGIEAEQEKEAAAASQTNIDDSHAAISPSPKSASVALSPVKLLPMHRLTINSTDERSPIDRRPSESSQGFGAGLHDLPGLDTKRRRLDIGGPAADYRHDSVAEVLMVHQNEDRRITLPPAAELIGRISPQNPIQYRGAAPGYGQGRMMVRRPAQLRDLRVNLPAGPQTSYDMNRFRSPHTAYPRTTMTATFPPGAYRAINQITRMDVLKDQYSVIRRVLSPLPAAPARRPDTFIIAVEGDRSGATHQLAAWLTDAIRRAHFDVSVVQGLELPEIGRMDMSHSFECMDHVKDWHGKSQELLEYMRCHNTGVVDLTRRSSGGEQDLGSQTARAGPTPVAPEKKSVILLDAYMYTVVNKFAAWIPMANGHDGQKHWDWIACMWRGLVAPELIVYLDTPRSEDNANLDRLEMLDSGNFMVVRRDERAGPATSAGGVTGVPDAALRRLAFEVEEWVRRQR